MRLDAMSGEVVPTRTDLRTQGLVDQGRARGFYDMLDLAQQAAGNTANANPQRNKVITRIVNAIANIVANRGKAQHAQLQQILDIYADQIASVLTWRPQGTPSHLCPTQVLAAMVLSARTYPDQTKIFAERFFSGARLEPADAELLLRTTLVGVGKGDGMSKAAARTRFTLNALRRAIAGTGGAGG